MLDTSVVIIPLERYNELLRTETRVNVLVERMYQKDYMPKEDILEFLGTELSVELATEIRNENARIIQECENRLIGGNTNHEN